MINALQLLDEIQMIGRALRYDDFDFTLHESIYLQCCWMAPRKSEDRRKDVYLTITPMKTLSFESESFLCRSVLAKPRLKP
eukprot:scaffold9054_cov137-Skeletonema_marinoi.AAC.7